MAWKLQVLRIMKHVASDGSDHSEFAKKFLEEALPPKLKWEDTTRCGSETVYRRQSGRTPFLDYMSTYNGDGEFTWHGDTLDGSRWAFSVGNGVDLVNAHYQAIRAELNGGE